MSQRIVAVCIAAPLVLILGGLALAVPLPYASYSPGPTFNVLGKDSDQAEVIQVDGAKAYYDDGQIRFTTVLASGYNQKLSLGAALSRWIDPDKAVVPYDVVHPADSTATQEKAEGAVEMTTSQDVAKAVAMQELGLTVPSAIQIAYIDPTGPSARKLLVRDVVKKVDGKPVATSKDIQSAVETHDDGTLVELRIERDRRELTVRIKPAIVDGKPRIGVQLGQGYEFPFTVNLRVDPNVGGPSAGLMFSLAIYDTLTPGSLTGGRTIAGTGEILPDGSVGPIGGIAQKIAGAQAAGAKLFFVPKDNCADVKGLDPDLRLVKATTMHEAREALQTWVKDPEASLPTC